MSQSHRAFHQVGDRITFTETRHEEIARRVAMITGGGRCPAGRRAS